MSTYRLHFNRSNGIYSLRDTTRYTVAASGRNSKLPLFGNVVPVPEGFVLVTPGEYKQAAGYPKKYPAIESIETHWPRLRLFIKAIKEVF